MKDLSDLKFQTVLLLAVLFFLPSKSQAASEEEHKKVQSTHYLAFNKPGRVTRDEVINTETGKYTNTKTTTMAYNKLGRIDREEVIDTETGESSDADALREQLDGIPQDKSIQGISDTGEKIVDRTTSQVDRTMDRIDRIDRTTSQGEKLEKDIKS